MPDDNPIQKLSVFVANCDDSEPGMYDFDTRLPVATNLQNICCKIERESNFIDFLCPVIAVCKHGVMAIDLSGNSCHSFLAPCSTLDVQQHVIDPKMESLFEGHLAPSGSEGADHVE